ncbi:MAG: hypothetical protein KDA68_11790, partial [Planctomycetaceae bacterium]|nr:hypothetical protein [Planctomycetaceae bacterium]
VVCEFEGTVPQMPTSAGLLHTVCEQQRVTLTYVKFGDEHRTALESLNPKRIEVVELGLEDAFIEYTRVSRGPLNLFSGDRISEDPVSKSQTA